MRGPSLIFVIFSPPQSYSRQSTLFSTGYATDACSHVVWKAVTQPYIHFFQLLDLGFDEERIVDALLKHDNDRDKALEELIA